MTRPAPGIERIGADQPKGHHTLRRHTMYLSITPFPGGYRVGAQLIGGHRSRVYIGYTRAQALKRARLDYGLEHKRLTVIDY